MDCKGVRNVREKGRNEFLCESQIVSVFSFYFFIFKLTSQRNASSRVVHTYDASISASTKKVSVNRDNASTSNKHKHHHKHKHKHQHKHKHKKK